MNAKPVVNRVVRHARPGKYEGGLYLDAWLDVLEDDGRIVSASGLLIRQYANVTVGELQVAARGFGDTMTEGEAAFLKDHPFAISVDTEEGFVVVHWFETWADMNEVWVEAKRAAEPEPGPVEAADNLLVPQNRDGEIVH